jgi:radical SAM enzyme (TIGR01210 family)
MPLKVNPLLVSYIHELREKYLERNEVESQPKLWGKLTETTDKSVITLVLPTRGCSWALSKEGGCSVCGYVNDSARNRPIPFKEILTKIIGLLNQTDPEKPIELKLFNSGSFFDEKDVPKRLREKIIEEIKKYPNILKVSVESRPEYIINFINIIKETTHLLEPKKLEIGIGLESSNNAILRDCWNKGSSLEDYQESMQILRPLDVQTKSYIFIKPPFLTEREAIYDAIQTGRTAATLGTNIISFNPCNIQNGTLVHYLFKKDRYDPPWLWSLLFIIKTVHDEFPDTRILFEPIAAGKSRGVHNCGQCDKKVLHLIDRIINDKKIVKDLQEICPCSLKWKTIIDSPIEFFRTRNISKIRFLNPFDE